MTPQEFIAKWQKARLSERSAYQQHFCDLCDVLGQPKPAQADPEGAWYTFERGVQKTTGQQGWADVWMRGHFGWEYKGKHKDLDAAYQQLLLYREDLENPPLLVVCDLDRFHVHTNFTGTAKQVHRFDLEGLADPQNLDVLRKVFTEPESLRPGLTTESITRHAAERFGILADGMRIRGVDAPVAAHFLMKLMFCMFGEDIGLLPKKIFGRVLEGSKNDPPRLAERLGALFEAMSEGGDFGADAIAHFDGGLFADADVVELRPAEVAELIAVNDYDWANVEPSIFGTLFERTLDPAKRSQIGAHYTSRDDILTLLEPVVMAPLRREWDEVRARCDKLWDKVRQAAPKRSPRARKASKPVRDLERALLDFVERLAHVRILDPACGSGNFLYVAINLLLDLEKEVIAYGAGRGVGMLPHVRPTQLAGIEINPYAQQLAQVVIWIGYLQWMHHNGFKPPSDPVLEPIETIELRDAILDLSDPENPREPQWPEADFVVGNPPFLGSSLFRDVGIDDAYIHALGELYGVHGKSDLCCYWFERSRREIAQRKDTRVGLLATQSIRHGGSRQVLDAINRSGAIFFAISDRPWVLDGAAVRVSLIGFDAGTEMSRTLDGLPQARINSDLTGGLDLSRACRLESNLGIVFEGDQKGGKFDPEECVVLRLLHSPNPNMRPNSDVVFPRANANCVVKTRSQLGWIIDFGTDTPLESAARYEGPFQYVKDNVYEQRQSHSETRLRRKWWIHKRPRPEMRDAICRLGRYAVTPRVGKHRLFVWVQAPVVPDSRIFVFARDDDYFFGVLHSRVHENWTLRIGARHGDGLQGGRPTYNNTTCFETFPFPEPTEEHRAAIAEAARELDTLRSNWLNPPEWTREEVLEFPGSADGPWARYVYDPDKRGIGTVRYPRVVARDEECAGELKRRTLTNLYNERPTWLDLAHRKLDEAVLAAYGWAPDISDEDLLARLLDLNLERADAS